MNSVVTAVGISVVDHIMIVDGFVSAEGSFHCERYMVEGGGMAATALAAASRLGSVTRLFSRTGDDLNASFIIEGLKQFGIDTAGVIKVPGRSSTVSFVLVDKTTGEKQFYSEWDKPAYIDHIELDVTRLDGTAVLLLDGHWIEGARDAVQWAHRRGIPVVADFKRKYRGIETLFPFIDYFIIPDFFAKELVPNESMDTVLRRLADLQSGIPVVTEGGNGGVYIKDGEIRRYRAFTIDNVDSTGAGDAFHGAFCHFLAKGYAFEHCIELSSAVGALNCRAFGGRTALPTIDELSAFLTEHNCEILLP